MASTRGLDKESQPDHSRSGTLASDEIISEKGSVDVEASGVDEPVYLSRWRKLAVLCILCSAQFFDLFYSNAVIVSLPSLGQDLNVRPDVLQWILSVCTLTAASFMLISGSVSDIFHPKPIFCVGFAVVGLFSIPVAASVHPIMSIVFRAIQGIGIAMNVPSAVAMIRITFPDPIQQSTAYAWYSVAGATGNVLGFIIGGVLTARTSWRWVHYLEAILVIPLSVAAWFILPTPKLPPNAQRRSIDFPGVLTLTAGLILFVYAVSEGGGGGWGTPQVITTLILSVFVCAAFLLIEKYVKDPALPPRMWKLKNFFILFIYAWSPYWWTFSCELQLVNVFTVLWQESALKAGVRCLPLGIAGAIASYLTGKISPRAHPNVLLVGGQVLTAVGSVLFALAGTPDKYWPYIFPGMIIGMFGLAAEYVGAMITMMQSAGKGEEGVVGGVLYTAYHVGSTFGFAITTSISQAVNSRRPMDPISQFDGYAASFWSLVALPGIMAILALLFVRR